MLLRKTAAAGALGLLLANGAAVQAETAPGPVIEASRQVTSDGGPLRLWDIPALAVDPRDPETVVMAVGNARDGGCGLRVSRDGGESWTTTAASLLPEGKQYCIQNAQGPVMAPAFTPDGTLYVSMSATSDDTGRTNGPIDWVLARTQDLGVTHDNVTIAKSETTNVDPTAYGGQGTPQVGNSWYKFHSLAVDPRNPQRLYAGARYYVWGKDLQSLPGDIPLRPYVAVSDDGGRTWAKPVDLLGVANGDNVAWGGSSPMLVVAPNGDIYGVSKELLKSAPAGQKNPDPRILLFKSTDGGKSWATSTVNNGGPSLQATPEVAVDPHNGTLYVTYGSVRPRHRPTSRRPHPRRCS